ncbi:SPX domain protein, partial [Oesophagostomum dentatum]
MGATSGLIVAGIAGATAIGISFAAIPFVAPALRRVCIPYVPATPPQLKNVSRALAECTPKQGPLIDLGSGDGRVVSYTFRIPICCFQMKFGEQLASHLTPEWRKQYIDYEALKNLLYDNMLEVPSEEDRREEHIAQMDEKFFNECDKELTKINLFFSQKIAEAQGKYHELQSELQMFKEVVEQRAEPTTLRRRFGARDKLHKETTKTAQQLKLAFSEFYLSLVLVQNYQQLNGTGFRKILKKHDKLTGNERGLDWRINKVEKSSFFLNREIETLINNVETSVINELEGGNRQAGMKRLKVPPLSEKQKPITTFSLGLFMGASLILITAIVLSYWGAVTRPNEPQWVAVRLFRGPLLLFLSIFMCGVNMAGWA